MHISIQLLQFFLSVSERIVLQIDIYIINNHNSNYKTTFKTTFFYSNITI